MEDKIVYKYEHKDDILSELVMKLVDKLYSVSYPRPIADFKTMAKFYESVSRNGYKFPIDFYYIPYNVYKVIVDDFLEKYGIEFHWKNNMDFLQKILFEDGGLKEVYTADEHNEKPYRHCIDIKTLDNYIPKEYAEKVKEIIKGYADTYKFGSRDYMTVSFNVSDIAPCSLKDRVVKAWKEVFGKDIEIPNDGAWIDEYGDDEIEETEYEDITDEQEDENSLS